MTAIEKQGDAVVDGVDVDAVLAAVQACRGVAGLTAGWPGGPHHLPARPAGRGRGRRRRRRGGPGPGPVGVTAREVAGEVRAAVAPLTAGRRVDVVIADLEDPPAAGVEVRTA